MTQPINIAPNAAPSPPPPPKPGISPSLVGGILLIAVALVGGVELGRTVLAPQPPAPTPTPPAPPAAVAISGPASASVGRQVKLAIKGASGARTEWTLPPGDFEQDTGGALAYFVPTSATPSPAVFTAKTLVVQGSAIVDGPTGSFSLPIVGATPTPPPNPTPPNPTPPNPPAPAAKTPLRVSVIYDPSSKTPDIAAITNSPTIGGSVGAIGSSIYRTFPKGDAASTAMGLDSIAASFGLPCVIVQDATGLVSPGWTFKLPATEADLVSHVKSIASGGSN